MENKKIKLQSSHSGNVESTGTYKGFSLRDSCQIETIDVNSVDSKSFYNKYISQRKPVIIKGKPKDLNLEHFKLDKIVENLNWSEKLKVERRYNNGFGSNLKRDEMHFETLVSKLKSGDSSYYLTTQYDANSDDEDNDSEEEYGDYANLGGFSNSKNGAETQDTDGTIELGTGDDEIDENAAGQHYAEDISDDSDDFGCLDDIDSLRDDYDELNEQEGSDVSESGSSDEISDSEESDYRVRELFQPPLTNLAGVIPSAPHLFETLIPQQINLWMGCSDQQSRNLETISADNKFLKGNGTSSGLHHDHADNLYILLQGRKRFTLFSPDYAFKLYTVGKIYKLFNSGVIDYDIDENAPDWKHVREDGALLSNIEAWKSSKQNSSGANRDEVNFTKKSNKNLPDEDASTEKPANPPSFSRIPPMLLHIEDFEQSEQDKLKAFADLHFPGILDIPKVKVNLNPGDMLYLPTGWFHEVTSFGTASSQTTQDNVHLALNYWFIPPVTNDYLSPYSDDYWKEDYIRTMAAVSSFIPNQKS